jgi:hypothetical protein
VMKVTLDTNVIIELESVNPSGDDLGRLLALHETGAIHLQVPGIIASERVRAGGFLPNFSAFTARIRRLSRRSINVLKPIGRWDITYWDEGLWADDDMIALEEKISAILFPTHHYDWATCAREVGLDPAQPPSEQNPIWRKWRNRLCDCAGLWCHIYYSGDIFVTSDKNFLGTKRTQLEALGARRILPPCQARGELSAQLSE